MYYFDNQQHNMPHIHVHYQENAAIIEIPTGSVIQGVIPPLITEILSRGYAAFSNCLGGTPPMAVCGRSLLYDQSHCVANN